MLSNNFALEVPTLTRELADQIAMAAKRQLETSISYKAPRLEAIKENENLYFGVVEKQNRNPFNECFPFLSGAVDHFLSKIDDPPRVRFKSTRDAAWKTAQKVQAAWDQQLASSLPNAKYRYKDRVGKKLGLMGGRTIHKYFAESPTGKYRSVFSTVDYKLFHSQPDGGGHLENHLYCGEEGVFLTKETLARGAQLGYYDKDQIAQLLQKTGNAEYQQNEADQNELNSRHAALNLDPASHTYTGQQVFHLVDWYITFQGVRWYVLFDKWSGMWVRIKPLRELASIPKGYEEALFPYTSWATFEEFGLFWSKGNADDWRPAARFFNRFLNQELYNREKMNKGQRLYDPDMILDVGSLADWRPDGLTPVNTRNGKTPLDRAVYKLDIAGLNGTIDLAQYVEAFVGRSTASTASSKGASEKDKKVGIFFGELQQIDEYIGTRNKSYTENWEEIALRFLIGLKDNLPEAGIAVQITGEAGFVAESLTQDDMQYMDDLSISVVSGNEEDERNIVDKKDKRETLALLTTVNPRWKDEQLLRTSPFNEEDIREAFDYKPNLTKALLSEAAQAIETIKAGHEAKLNSGANTAFMEYIVNAANANEDLDTKVRIKIIDYANAHGKIAAKNEARAALELRSKLQAAQGLSPDGGAPGAGDGGPGGGAPGAGGGNPIPAPRGGGARDSVFALKNMSALDQLLSSRGK